MNVDENMKSCAVCGKQFYKAYDHIYKYKPPKGVTNFFCSWGCMRKAEKEREEQFAKNRKKMGRKKTPDGGM